MIWFYGVDEDGTLVPLGNVEDFASYFAGMNKKINVFALSVTTEV